jgi:hypothetical protein
MIGRYQAKQSSPPIPTLDLDMVAQAVSPEVADSCHQVILVPALTATTVK